MTRRLLRSLAAREDLDDYLRHGGYRRLVSGSGLLTAMSEVGLRGRGGAGFPVAVKWRTLADAPRPVFAVANGEEGEPHSAKDRWLLRWRPHIVLEGLRLAAEAVRAEEAWVYVSDQLSYESVGAAAAELDAADLPGVAAPVRVHRTAHRYVSGEESAAVRAINGGPPLPTSKQTRVYQSGVRDRPTLVQNVETLAQAALIASLGTDAYAEVGLDGERGTLLLTLNGDCRRPGLYEVPLGTSVTQALSGVGAADGPPRGLLMGGYFSGLLGPDALDYRLSHEALRRAGAGLGCAAITVLGQSRCMLKIASELARYYAAESAEQCGVCIRGTTAIRDALDECVRGAADDDTTQRLARYAGSVRGRGACGLPDGVANVVESLLRHFPDTVEQHAAEKCERCPHTTLDLDVPVESYLEEASGHAGGH